MNSPLNEHQLLLSVANDDRRAFNELYRYYMSNLYSYIHFICKSRETTEEVVQDLFVKVWINRKNLENVRHFKSYLYRCAQNLLLDKIRKAQMESRFIQQTEYRQAEYQQLNGAERPDSPLICRDFKRITQDAINQLPEKRKRIVELRTHDELSLDEIAAHLSISKSVVKKQLYSGLNFIREYIHKLDGLA